MNSSPPSKRNNILFNRESVFTTIFTFLIAGLLSLVFINTKYLDPIYNALKDFQFTDVYYSAHVARNMEEDDLIYIVNIGELDRTSIAEQLEVIQSFNPKAVGLDATFDELKSPEADSLLKKVISTTPNLSLAIQINKTGGSDKSKCSSENITLLESNDYFEVDDLGGGASFLADSGTTVRYFAPFTQIGRRTIPCFPAKIVEKSDVEQFQKLERRRKSSEIIHYSGKKFKVFQPSEITLDNKKELSKLKDKYVLMGFVGLSDCTQTLQDLHLTPLNGSYGGHSIPDMYGVEIHAHILSMILNESYIYEPPKFVIWILAFVVTLVHVRWFLKYFVGKRHVWFHLVAKSVQFVSFAILFILSLLLYGIWNIKIEPAVIMIGVILSVDALYFLDGIMQWLNKRFEIRSYFSENHEH